MPHTLVPLGVLSCHIFYNCLSQMKASNDVIMSLEGIIHVVVFGKELDAKVWFSSVHPKSFFRGFSTAVLALFTITIAGAAESYNSMSQFPYSSV